MVFNLFGGLDSFNVLAPKDEDDCSELFADWSYARGNIGMTNGELLPINATGSDQPCTHFGVHNKLGALKDIYDAEDGVFLANFGHLSKLVTKNNWKTETRTDLFSHFKMNYEAQYVDAFQEQPTTGVLGRFLDIMQETYGMSVGPISIDSLTVMLDGKPETGRLAEIIPTNGVSKFNFDTYDITESVTQLNAGTELNSGFYGNHFSQGVIDTMNKTEMLAE